MVDNDRFAIDDLTHAYADAVCRNDRGAWLDTWADDGIWNIGRGPVVGRAALAGAFAAAMGLFEAVLQSAGSGTATVDGDSGTGRRYMQEVARTATGRTTLYHGYYDDTYVRTGAGWRFAERRLVWLYQGPPDLSGTFGPPPGYDDLTRRLDG
ncbi:MAG: nuclear transport factor 2 family protein [Acidimicrobiales bacterium]